MSKNPEGWFLTSLHLIAIAVLAVAIILFTQYLIIDILKDIVTFYL